MTQVLTLAAGGLLLAACANRNMASRSAPDRDAAVQAPSPQQVAKRAPPARKPDAAAPRQVMHQGARYSAVGWASWYGAGFHGRRTADGETFDMNSLTAAHRTLPLPCTVRVTNLANRRSIVVRVNDRGPFTGGRVIDVSARTAKVLGFYGHGVAKVKVDYIGRAPIKSALYQRTVASE